MTPQPAWQTVADIGAGHVGGGPFPQGIETLAVVANQREQHAVGLAFGGAVIGFDAGLQQATVVLHETRGVGLPKRPIGAFARDLVSHGRCQAQGRQRASQPKHGPAPAVLGGRIAFRDPVDSHGVLSRPTAAWHANAVPNRPHS
ncbi:hypothetical protein D3C73_1293510 [compost metagenome]